MIVARRAVAWVAAFFVLASVLLASRPAFAFPWMIREGYNQCNTCHADPSGAGILTAYGRGMEEVVLRTQYKKNPDQDPGTLGNFAFGVTLPEQLLVQTDVRNLLMVLSPGPLGNAGNTQVQDILMQLDQSAQLKVGRFRINGSIGYSPPTSSSGSFTFAGGGLGATLTPPDTWGAIVARQYWLGLDLGKDEQFLLRLGRMNVPYGIRTIEHPFLVRAVTRTDIDKGQQHGLSLSYSGEKLRGEAMVILGNYAIHGDASAGQWDAPHERGGSAFFEWMPKTNMAFGASGLVTYAAAARQDYDPSLDASAPIIRQAWAVHARYSPVKALVLLAEADALNNSQQLTDATGATYAVNHFGLAGMLQADLQVIQGVHVLATGEAYNGHIQDHTPLGSTYDTTTAVGWFGLWWFFAPHFDWRVDLVYSSNAAPGLPPLAQGLSFLTQVHGYL
jgi:hypothetical protein